MGCSSSGVSTQMRVTSPRRADYLAAGFDEKEEIEAVPAVLTKEERQKRDVNSILNGMKSIHIPRDSIPIVSLSEDSFPVVLCNFAIVPIEKIYLVLPVIVISNTEMGKYIVVGMRNFLSHLFISKTETAALFENIGVWASNFRLKTVRILIYNFPSKLMSSACSDLKSYAYFVDHCSILPEKLPYDFIICPEYVADEEELDKLENYARNGCLLVCATPLCNPKCTLSINNLLHKVGIAIPETNFTSVSSDAKICNYNELKERTVGVLCERFLAMLDSDELDEDELDATVATLRFYASNLGPEQGELAAYLTDKCWEFLERIGYIEDGFYCTGVIQSVIAILISDIMPQLPANLIKAAPPSKLFPGECKDYDLESVKMHLNLSNTAMHSTGLYLPPGSVSIVQTTGSISLQIGSHESCLIEKTGNWRRWPVITSYYDLDAGTTDIASPFGGIVYISQQEKFDITVILKNFARYRRYSVSRGSWNGTEKSPIPWCEIDSKHITVTIPILYLDTFDNRMQENFSLLEQIIDESISFISVKRVKKRRVVFDADLTSDVPEVGNVITLKIDELPDALDTSVFSESLLRFISLVVMATIPDGYLDDDAVLAIATISAYYVLSKHVTENFPASINDFEAQPLFKQLWGFVGSNPQSFTNGMNEFFSSSLMKDEDASNKWKKFVETLMKHAKVTKGDMKKHSSLVKLNDRFKMTELLSCNSSDFLQMYVLDDLSQ